MKRLVALLIKIAFYLRLRRPANNLQRWLRREHKATRATLPRFPDPEAMTKFGLAHFQYREDKGFLTPDWSTHPEVFQARLAAPGDTDGDCDDYHAWAAELLSRMPDVDRVMRMSCWTWKSGHTTAVFERGGQLWLVDYDLYPVADYRAALERVRTNHKWQGELKGWVFEDVDLNPIAIWPRSPDV